MYFTLIIPILDEEQILERNAVAIYDYMQGLSTLDSFEIFLACNGCTDSSEEIARELADTHQGIRYCSIKERGLGGAIRTALADATYDTTMFYAIDLPFGLDVIGNSIEAASRNAGAVVIGSKAHKDSVVQIGAMRRFFSRCIRMLNNLFFGLGVGDTQGSILFSRETVMRYLEFIDDQGAFFQAQIVIYSKMAGAEFIEIPIRVHTEVRESRFRSFDALKYIMAVFREKRKLLGRAKR